MTGQKVVASETELKFHCLQQPVTVRVVDKLQMQMILGTMCYVAQIDLPKRLHIDIARETVAVM